MTAAIAPRTLSDLIPVPRLGERTIARRAVLIGGFAVFTAALAQVQIHLPWTPVPITGQTLGVLLAGVSLGGLDGALSQVLYWVLGLTGLPFYAGGDGGWHNGTGATLGYFAGFVVAAALVGALAERRQDRTLLTAVPAMVVATFAVYVFGVAWLAHYVHVPVAVSDPNVAGGETGISLGLTPFLIGDALKVLVAGSLTPLAWKLAGRSSASARGAAR